MILHSYPSLDVHGETRDTVVYPVKEFIYDNYKLENKYIVIIHGGKGNNILKQTVHEILKSEPRVKEFHLDEFNLGATLVELNITSKFDKTL